MVYKTPKEITGVKKTMVLPKILSIPISPSLSVFTKKGKKTKEITFVIAAVAVYIPTCVNDFLETDVSSFGNKKMLMFR